MMNQSTNVLYITRFVASIMIVVLHFAPGTLWNGYYHIIKNGGEAVNYFFFISGFVMIISNKRFLYTTDKYSVISKREFWLKRFARIYPLYLVALLLVVAFHYLISFVDKSILARLPFEILAIQRWLYAGSINFPGWSISCELLFYIVFPFLLGYINKLHSRYIYLVFFSLVTSTIISYVLLLLQQYNLNPFTGKVVHILYQHPIFKLPIFMFGTVCGIVYVNNSFAFFNSRVNSVIGSILSLLLITSLLIILPKDNFFIESGLLTLVYFFFLLSICNLKGKEAALFSNKVFIFLGDISYGIYILQYPVFLLYKHYVGNVSTALEFACFIATLVIAASFTFYVIENPFKKLILSYNRKLSFN